MTLQPSRHFLEVADVDDGLVAKFTTKSLGEANVEAIGEQLFDIADSLQGRKLYVDFGTVEFLTSHALGKLVTIHKRVLAAGGQLVLVNLAPHIHAALKASQLNTILDARQKGADAPNRG